RTSSWQYDVTGQLVTYTTAAYTGLPSTDPPPPQTVYRYDALGRQTSVTVAANYTSLAQTTSYLYDAGNHVTEQTDPRGVRTAYEYDHLGRRTVVDEAVGIWDEFGQVLERTTHYGYDALDRITSQTDALGNVTSTTYDPNGAGYQVDEGYNAALAVPVQRT